MKKTSVKRKKEVLHIFMTDDDTDVSEIDEDAIVKSWKISLR